MFSCSVLHPYSKGYHESQNFKARGKNMEKIKVAEQTNMELTAPEKHISKIHLHVEQFSQKAN